MRERRRMQYKLRIRAMIKDMALTAWTRAEMTRLLNRIVYISGEEGVTDPDLRVIVRLYNRELIGRRKEQ